MNGEYICCFKRMWVFQVVKIVGCAEAVECFELEVDLLGYWLGTFLQGIKRDGGRRERQNWFRPWAWLRRNVVLNSHREDGWSSRSKTPTCGHLLGSCRTGIPCKGMSFPHSHISPRLVLWHCRTGYYAITVFCLLVARISHSGF